MSDMFIFRSDAERFWLASMSGLKGGMGRPYTKYEIAASIGMNVKSGTAYRSDFFKRLENHGILGRVPDGHSRHDLFVINGKALRSVAEADIKIMDMVRMGLRW